jgi:glycosyltransferase involved in cell wall biosynthesis
MIANSIRTLFISRDPPYPPISGTSLRIWQNVNIMRRYGPVAFFTSCRWEPTNTSLPKIDVWRHYNVDRPRSWSEQLERKIWWLRPFGHPTVDWVYANIGARQLDELLAEFKPDLTIFEEVWMHRYLSVVQRYPCRTILLEHNIEASIFEAKYASDKSLKAKLKKRVEFPKVKSIESNFVRQVDRVWVCSDRDAQLLNQLYGQTSPVQVIPNGVDIAYYQDVYSGQCDLPNGLEEKHRNILFLGQLSYAPNTEAVELLINAIYPRLRETYPECRLLLVGARPTESMLAAARREPGIVVTDQVPDVRPYLAAASLMVVPLNKGGGTRLKILEAFAAGCPVVSTTKGAEGLSAKDGEHLLIRNSIDEIVAGISQLLSDRSVGETLARSAYEFVKAQYSWEAINQRVEASIQELF